MMRTRSGPPGTRGFCSAAAPERRSFRRQCHAARTTCCGTRGPSTPPRSAAAPAPGCAGAEPSDAAGVSLEAQKESEKQRQDPNGISRGAVSFYFSQMRFPTNASLSGWFFVLPGRPAVCSTFFSSRCFSYCLFSFSVLFGFVTSRTCIFSDARQYESSNFCYKTLFFATSLVKVCA